MEEGKDAPAEEGSTTLREDGDAFERGAGNMYSDEVLPPTSFGSGEDTKVRAFNLWEGVAPCAAI